MLYEHIGRPDPGGSGNGLAVLLGLVFSGPEVARQIDDSAPEGFGKFLRRVIEEKKRRVEDELGL